METQDKDRDPRPPVKTEPKPQEQPLHKHDDPIDEASDDSFPASDPPAH
ncbi:MAG: hypothetical protein ABUT39_07675 [Acidobacteriota bacterium]